MLEKQWQGKFQKFQYTNYFVRTEINFCNPLSTREEKSRHFHKNEKKVIISDAQ